MQLQNLLRRANEISQQTDNPTNNNNNNANEYKEIWKRIRKLKPRWAEANARYGMALLGTPNNQKKAIELLHRSIDIGGVVLLLPPLVAVLWSVVVICSK